MNEIYSMVGNFPTLGANLCISFSDSSFEIEVWNTTDTAGRNDSARYSKKLNSPYVQLIVNPAVFIVMMLFGIIGVNGSKILFGELLWDPLLIVKIGLRKLVLIIVEQG